MQNSTEKPKKSLIEQTNELQTIINTVDRYLEDDTEPPKEIVERLHAMMTNQADKIDSCAAFVKRSEMNKSWLQDEKKRLDMAIRKVDRGIKRMKDISSIIMDQEDIRKLEGSKGHFFSKQRTFAVEVLNEDILPEDYLVVKKTPDKAKLKRDLTNGVEIPGARLIEYSTIQVR